MAERPGVAGVRAGVQEAPGGAHLPVGRISRRPGSVLRLARHHPPGLAGRHRMKHEPRRHKIAHGNEEYHARRRGRTRFIKGVQELRHGGTRQEVLLARR